ncbi:MAG: hypothetical protein M3348_09685 [Acidobacteriota bacterium]|nr:hypothetical protein [Acidobacteriota bacterium]
MSKEKVGDADEASNLDAVAGQRGWQLETSKLEEVRIVGPFADGSECLQWLYDNGFSVQRSGPYTDRDMHPDVDITRFLFTAVRKIDA